MTIYDGQVSCSLTESKVFEVLKDQIRRVNELFSPQTYFLSHDEIRVANWSEPELASGRTARRELNGHAAIANKLGDKKRTIFIASSAARWR